MSYAKLTNSGLPIVRTQTRTPSVVFNDHYRLISELTEAQRQSVDWASFHEVPMNDSNYLPGIPLDTLTVTGVTRTYPNPILRSLEDVRKAKLIALATHRYNVENGGMIWNATDVDTTDRTKMLVTGAFAQADGNPQYTKSWKVAPGQYVALSNLQLKDLANAMDAHVTAAFKAEEAHSILLMAMQNAADVVDHDFRGDILGSEWPLNPVRINT